MFTSFYFHQRTTAAINRTSDEIWGNNRLKLGEHQFQGKKRELYISPCYRNFFFSSLRAVSFSQSQLPTNTKSQSIWVVWTLKLMGISGLAWIWTRSLNLWLRNTILKPIKVALSLEEIPQLKWSSSWKIVLTRKVWSLNVTGPTDLFLMIFKKTSVFPKRWLLSLNWG